MLLQDKIIIVSGIGPGLGIALALCAAKEGVKGIALAARTAEKLADAEQQINALNLDIEVLKVPTDISKREDCNNLIALTVEKWGRVDALINSAYISGKFGPIEFADFADWRKTLDVNLFGSLQLSQAAIPSMKKHGGGAIVMVNSMVTRKSMPYQGGYATSKGALSTATKSLAKEVGAYGIRVNSVFMGWMWGQNVKIYVKGAAKQRGVEEQVIIDEIVKEIPLGFIPTDVDCADPCIFLASDQAKVITGASLDINGGEYMPL